MNKTTVWANVQNQVSDLLGKSKINKTVSDELMAILESYIAPTTRSNNPEKEIDGVIHYFCRFHQKYEPVQNMVMSNGKSKGYCRAAISLWNKTNSKIKKIDAACQKFVLDGEIEKSQEMAKKSQELKALLNNPEHYDIERDWLTFNTKG